MSKVRIGFVGAGNMGQCAHLKNYVTIPDCEVVALAEMREGLGKAVAQRYGIPKLYKSHEELLANEKLDGIVASQPFWRHRALVVELLKAGIPVLTEKPIANTVENGQCIVDAVESSNTWMMIGYHKRSDPAIMYAKAEIERLKETKELGKLKYVRILMPAGDWIANGFLDLIRSDEPVPELPADPPPSDMDADAWQTYYDPFVNYYIHQINLMRHLLGEDYKVAYADPSGVILAVQSDSGVAGVIEMTPYATTVDWQESALIAFERGWIKVELPAPLACNRPGTVSIMRDPERGKVPQTMTPSLPWVHAMRQQAINFIDAIKGEREPTCTAEEALKDLVSAREYIQLWKGV